MISRPSPQVGRPSGVNQSTRIIAGGVGACARCMSPTSCRPGRLGIAAVGDASPRRTSASRGAGEEQELLDTGARRCRRGCRHSARARRTRAARVGLLQPVRPEADGVDHLADGAGLRPARRPSRSRASRNARNRRSRQMRPVSACTRRDLGELVEGGHARLVAHHVLAVPHRLDGDRARARPGWPP